MIIIKTTNGDVMVNEKETVSVRHDREKRQAYVVRKDGSSGTLMSGLIKPIENVEGVYYYGDGQLSKYEDEGSVIQFLKKRNSELRNKIDYKNEVISRLEVHTISILRTYSNLLGLVRGKIDDEVYSGHENNIDNEQQYIDYRGYDRDMPEWLKAHESSDATSDEIAQLYDTIATMQRDHDEATAAYKREIALRIRIIDNLRRRNWWQRLFNMEDDE